MPYSILSIKYGHDGLLHLFVTATSPFLFATSWRLHFMICIHKLYFHTFFFFRKRPLYVHINYTSSEQDYESKECTLNMGIQQKEL
jgi:hypothetical protein